jgi:tetratricopeptide (TPR) repeat protein
MRLDRGPVLLQSLALLFVPFQLAAQSGVVTRAEALTAQRSFDTAVAMLEVHLDRYPDDAAAWRQLGATLLAGGEWDGAIDAAERAVSLRPDDVAYRLSLGDAYREKARRSSMFSAIKNAKKWKAELEYSIERWPDDMDVRRWLVAYLLNAPGVGGGDKDRALAIARETMQYEAYEGRLLIAYSHRIRKEYDEAVVMYDSCAAIYPDSGRVWGAYAKTLRVAGRLGPAEACFENWVRLAPDDPEAYSGLGNWARDSRLFDRAEAAYRTALEVDPYYSEARYNLARMLENNRDFPAAQREYNTIVELTPEFVEVGDAKKRAYKLKRKM